MFYYLSGTLAERDINTCVIDCGGVGYKLTVSLLTSEALGAEVGKTVKLFTHLAVREDGVELFGFHSPSERDTFNLLIGVSGIGPKAAISILSVLSPDRLATAICTGDVKAISKAPGVGNKTAERVILELKDKVAKNKIFASSGSTAGAVSAAHVAARGPAAEAVEALLVLGYDKSTAVSALAGADQSADVSTLIRYALKQLSK